MRNNLCIFLPGELISMLFIFNISFAYTGLPKAWIRIMNSQITPDEQQKNPDAAYQALKFYNFSIKKREPAEVLFKPFITEEDIAEESKQIANYVNLKSTHKSQDSLSSGSEKDVNLSSEEPPPPLPAKNKVELNEVLSISANAH